VLVKELHNTYPPLPILLLHGSHLHCCVNSRMCNFAGGGSGSPWKKGLPPPPSGRGTTGDPRTGGLGGSSKQQCEKLHISQMQFGRCVGGEGGGSCGVGVDGVGGKGLCLWWSRWCRPYRDRVMDNIVVVSTSCRFICEHHSGFIVVSKNQDGKVEVSMTY
jgi:hypothetical protein